MVQLLVEHGANVNHKNKQYRDRTPLHTAAVNGLLDVAQYLTGLGADLDAIDNEGETPLDKALSPARDLSMGMGMPTYPGDVGKQARKRAVAQYLREQGANSRSPETTSLLLPEVRDQLEGIIPGLVFKAAHIYLRGKSPDSIIAAVESKIDCQFMEGVPPATQEEIRREIRSIILAEYERSTRP